MISEQIYGRLRWHQREKPSLETLDLFSIVNMQTRSLSAAPLDLLALRKNQTSNAPRRRHRASACFKAYREFIGASVFNDVTPSFIWK